nr:oligosaccharide flippase family protein [Sulfolobus islandicus]
MNPLSGALKFLSATLFNSVLGLVFFLIAGHFATPSFVGKVAIIQVTEIFTGYLFSILPYQLITREVAHYYSSSQCYNRIVYMSLSYSVLISPFLLFLFFFPSYLWMSIPYFILYLFTNYQGQLLTGLGKFTEVNIGNALFTISRWGFSIVAIFYHSVELLILIWTLGALLKVIYYQLYLPFKLFIDKTIFKEIVKVGFPIYLTGVISFISAQGDRVVTAFLLGSYYLGIYQLVALPALVPSMLISSFSSSLLPSSTYYYAKGKDIKEMSSISFRIVTLISLPMAILGYAISPLFISKLFPQYVLGIQAMQLLILSLTSTMPLQLLSTFLVAAKKNYRGQK